MMAEKIQRTLTSAAFVCDKGLRVFDQIMGRQETTIVFTTGKVHQRFFIPEVAGKAAISYEYQLTGEETKELLALFYQLDCFNWGDNHRGNRRSDGWEVRLRAGEDLVLRGLFQPPMEVRQVEKRLLTLIDFEYPLMLCSAREVKRDQSVKMLRQLEPFLHETEDPQADAAERMTNQLLERILVGETGQRLLKTPEINGVEVAGTFLHEMLLAENRINRWRRENGEAFGLQHLCELLLREDLYLEDATDIITLTMMALEEEQLITKDGLREVSAGILAGYQVHCIEEDHPLRKRQTAVPEKIIDLRSRKKQRELLGE